MTEPSAIAASIVIVLTALSAAVALIIKALGENTRATMTAATEQALQLQHIQAKTDVVLGHVNSAASRNAAVIAAQETQLGMLRDQIADLKQTALLLAQTRAVKVSDSVTGQTLVAHDAWEREERAKTTEAVAENTALTREILDAVKRP
jgi:hypothetical protein